jgi:hypothetical protein
MANKFAPTGCVWPVCAVCDFVGADVSAIRGRQDERPLGRGEFIRLALGLQATPMRRQARWENSAEPQAFVAAYLLSDGPCNGE